MNENEPPFIIRAERRRAYDEAETILAAAKAEAAQIRSEAAEQCTAALAAARVEGLNQAAVEAAAFAAATARSFDAFWAARAIELRELAFAIAHRILSQIPPDELVLRLASDAIADYGRNVELFLRASPTMAESLRQALANVDSVERVSVIADSTLTDGECTLVHPQGQARIGLLDQFRAMLSYDESL